MTPLARTALVPVALCVVTAGPARADDWSAWQRAYDPATRTRFIPVELWTGAPWDGTHSLRFHWLLMEGRGRGTDMRYVYSPLRGLVDVHGNE